MFIIPALICSAISIGWKARLLAKNFAARAADLSTSDLPVQRSSHVRLDFNFVMRYRLHIQQTQNKKAWQENQYRRYTAYAYIMLAAAEVCFCVLAGLGLSERVLD